MGFKMWKTFAWIFASCAKLRELFCVKIDAVAAAADRCTISI